MNYSITIPFSKMVSPVNITTDLEYTAHKITNKSQNFMELNFIFDNSKTNTVSIEDSKDFSLTKTFDENDNFVIKHENDILHKRTSMKAIYFRGIHKKIARTSKKLNKIEIKNKIETIISLFHHFIHGMSITIQNELTKYFSYLEINGISKDSCLFVLISVAFEYSKENSPKSIAFNIAMCHCIANSKMKDHTEVLEAAKAMKHFQSEANKNVTAIVENLSDVSVAEFFSFLSGNAKEILKERLNSIGLGEINTGCLYSRTIIEILFSSEFHKIHFKNLLEETWLRKFKHMDTVIGLFDIRPAVYEPKLTRSFGRPSPIPENTVCLCATKNKDKQVEWKLIWPGDEVNKISEADALFEQSVSPLFLYTGWSIMWELRSVNGFGFIVKRLPENDRIHNWNILRSMCNISVLPNSFDDENELIILADRLRSGLIKGELLSRSLVLYVYLILSVDRNMKNLIEKAKMIKSSVEEIKKNADVNIFMQEDELEFPTSFLSLQANDWHFKYYNVVQKKLYSLMTLCETCVHESVVLRRKIKYTIDSPKSKDYCSNMALLCFLIKEFLKDHDANNILLFDFTILFLLEKIKPDCVDRIVELLGRLPYSYSCGNTPKSLRYSLKSRVNTGIQEFYDHSSKFRLSTIIQYFIDCENGVYTEETDKDDFLKDIQKKRLPVIQQAFDVLSRVKLSGYNYTELHDELESCDLEKINQVMRLLKPNDELPKVQENYLLRARLNEGKIIYEIQWPGDEPVQGDNVSTNEIPVLITEDPHAIFEQLGILKEYSWFGEFITGSDIFEDILIKIFRNSEFEFSNEIIEEIKKEDYCVEKFKKSIKFLQSAMRDESDNLLIKCEVIRLCRVYLKETMKKEKTEIENKVEDIKANVEEIEKRNDKVRKLMQLKPNETKLPLKY